MSAQRGMIEKKSSFAAFGESQKNKFTEAGGSIEANNT